jgi:hypothetical protein
LNFLVRDNEAGRIRLHTISLYEQSEQLLDPV